MKTIQTFLSFAAVGLLSSSSFANTFTLVSLSGDTADTNPEQTYESFSLPEINESGQVAFGARFANPELQQGFQNDLLPVFTNSCYQCHGEGGVQLNNIDLRPILTAQDLLARPEGLATIRNRINNNSMPPNSEPPLAAETKAQAISALDLLIEAANQTYAHLDAALQFDNGQLLTLAAKGEAATVNGEAGQIVSIRSVSATGGNDVAFIASLAEPHPLDGIDLLLSANANSQELRLHTHESTAPLVDFTGTLDNSRRHQILGTPQSSLGNAFSFWSRLRVGQTPDESGIWIVDLDSVSAPLNGQRLVAIGGSTANSGALAIEAPIASSFNASLAGAFSATLEDGDENSFNNDTAIWSVDSESNATFIAKTGDTAPGSTDTFLSFGKPVVDSDGDVYFWSNLLNENETEGLYRFSDGNLAALASTTEAIDIFGTSRTYSEFLDPVVNGNGDLAVLATETPESLQTILHRDRSGVWSIVAQSGMQAPGALPGVTFNVLSSPHLNGNGQVAFQASLSGSGDAISDTTDAGAWAMDSNGALALVAREGDTFEVRPGFPATVESATINGFNAANQIALNYSFTNGANAIAIVGLEDVAPPTIAEQPDSVSSFDGETIVFAVEANGQGPFQYQWKKDGVEIEGATNSALSIENASSDNDGAYTVVVSSTSGSTTSAVASLSIEAIPTAPVFVEQPFGDIAPLGTLAILDARAVSTSTVSYQWYFEGDLLSGETNDTLTFNPARAENEGSYHVVATSAGGSTASAAAEILLTDKRLINVAARSRVGSGANVLIAGFVVIGPDPKQILIRGIGPGLPESLDRLQNPRLEIYNSSNEMIHFNDSWGENADPDTITQAMLETGAGGGDPMQPGDTALLVELEQGLYTAIVRSQDDTSGIALVEAFEVSENLTRFVNVSSRAFVGAGDEVVIPGFIVQGDLPSRVLIRAIGPGLEKQNVAGVLEFPEITVYNILREPIAHNDGWGNLWNPAEINEMSALVNTPLLDEGSEDAALILELDPGLYTVKVNGENNTTGVALVEIFAIP
ncbi:MAG: immunoglobulin domain-containing protein [Opitutaceae bacterium]|nr:immunoglobulin domain-containing protein [Opitutaceae bacterium]